MENRHNNPPEQGPVEFRTGGDSRFVGQVTSNIKSDVIIITEVKLENILLKHRSKLHLRKSWIAPLSIFLATLVVHLTASFSKKFLFEPPIWQALFVLAMIASFAWLMVSLIMLIVYRKDSSLASLLTKIKNAEESAAEELGTSEQLEQSTSNQATEEDSRDFSSVSSNSMTDVETERPESQLPDLSDEAKRLLLEAVEDPGGRIVKARTSRGLIMQTNRHNFAEGANARSEAKWEGALAELCDLGFVQERGSKGQVFRITREGYDAADCLKQAI